ncbi:RNA polymerase sigma factor [Azospirillum picis]|uniref:RNA polymerase sigma factor n=1 Tax=Azospirillum picis TaxID=488438 RepID=A0ABU0MQH4_9PROT|nr:RNA polymerase sigma factor [Azospirillum picis]MBP2302143.1 RNA polymerase sigma-70 factor (ECF subfamily) [Azospirillum picis]MDQ0535722.1 RNA polymerase sigma-70 factor (ECF subfamily) [Azospirillum picis]
MDGGTLAAGRLWHRWHWRPRGLLGIVLVHGGHGAFLSGDGDSDGELMARVAGGDAAAFDRLAARHMRRAVALAQRMTGNPSDADEIAQEAFLRVWQHAGRWDAARAAFTTWLYRIVMNLAIDRGRRPGWSPLEAAGDPVDESADPLARIAERETAARVNQALAALPDRQRAAVVLFHQEGLSLRQASEILAMSESAFASLLARARGALKTALAAEKTA